MDICTSTCLNTSKKLAQLLSNCAGERATGVEPVNLFLGKEAFYQLNYARTSGMIILGFKKLVNTSN